MYASGLRVSELVHLKVKDVEIDRGFGWVRKGKGNKDRPFIIAEKLRDEIDKHICLNKLDSFDYLFKSFEGMKISPSTIQRIVKKAAKNAKIRKNVHPHTLRHSFATHLIEDGCDVKNVQGLLGHSNIQTTMVYVHIANPRLLVVKCPFDNL